MNDHSRLASTVQASTTVRERLNLTAGLWYLDRGWCTIPACPHDHSGTLPPVHLKECIRPGKRPPYCWKEYQERLPSPDTLRAWWTKNSRLNVGILLGRVSGLVGIDVDGPEGEELLLRLSKGDLPTTWEFLSGSGGRRLLYALPAGAEVVTTAPPTGKKPLHLLANGGYTVMPPSIHECGQHYVWINAPDDIFISGQLHIPNSSEILSATCNGLHTTKVVDAAMAPEWLLRKLDAKQRRFRQPGGGLRSEGMVGGLDLTDVRVARKYLRKCDPAISGQGGHSQTFKVACKLVVGFSLPADLALSLMMEEWNPRCEPPWSEAELRHKVEDAARVGSCPPMHNRNGQATAPPAPRATPKADNVSPQKDDNKLLSGVTGDRLLDKVQEFLWSRRVANDVVSIIEGVKGMGKSTIACAFAAHVTGGPRLWGDERPSQAEGNAAWFNREENINATTKRKLLLHGADLKRIIFPELNEHGDNQFRLLLPDHIHLLEDLIIKRDLKFIFIDNIFSFIARRLSIKDDRDLRDALEPAAEVARRHKCLILANRHFPKTQYREASHRGQGGVAISNVSRCIMAAEKHPNRPDRFLLSFPGHNLTGPVSSLIYRLDVVNGFPKVVFEGESPVTPDDMPEAPRDLGARKALIDAKQRIVTALVERGEVPATELLPDVEKAGPSRGTIMTAKAELEVNSRRRHANGKDLWVWVPPKGGFSKEVIDLYYCPKPV